MFVGRRSENGRYNLLLVSTFCSWLIFFMLGYRASYIFIQRHVNRKCYFVIIRFGTGVTEKQADCVLNENGFIPINHMIFFLLYIFFFLLTQQDRGSLFLLLLLLLLTQHPNPKVQGVKTMLSVNVEDVIHS